MTREEVSMLECRYHGQCRIEYEADFDVCCPCIGDGTDACTAYEPMPDVEALRLMADRLDENANDALALKSGILAYEFLARSLAEGCAAQADYIREALGDEDDEG